MGFFGAIADLFKHGHDQTVGRGLDMWQTNYLDRKIQNRTADLNRQLWTYQMSNAYQLTTDDLKQAGLNPMLAYMNGATSAPGHASSPSGYNGRKDSNWMPSQSLVAAKQLDVLESQDKKNEADAQLSMQNAKTVEESLRYTKAINEIILSKEPLKMLHAMKGVLPQDKWQALEAFIIGANGGNKGSNPNIGPRRQGTD